MAEWHELEAILRRRLQGERLAHTYRVVETARRLAARYRADESRVATAALLHDLFRGEEPARLLAEARRLGLDPDPVEVAQPLLLHGPVAAFWLEEQGLVRDAEVLDAIRYHTTARPGMGLVEKILWVADYIEPGRRFPGVERIRTLAEQSLDEALLRGLEQGMLYVISRGWLLHPLSVHARNALIHPK